MKTLVNKINLEFIIKAFFLSLIAFSAGSLIIGLILGLDTTPLA